MRTCIHSYSLHFHFIVIMDDLWFNDSWYVMIMSWYIYTVHMPKHVNAKPQDTGKSWQSFTGVRSSSGHGNQGMVDTCWYHEKRRVHQQKWLFNNKKMKVSTSNMYKYVSSIIKQLKTGPVQNQRFVWWYFVSGVSIWMCHLKLELDYPCVFVYSGFSTRKRKSQKRRVWPFQFLFGAVEQSWCSEQVYTVWTVYQTDPNRIRHYLRTKRCPAPLAGGLSRPPSQFSEGAPVSARSARTACLLFLQASLSHGQVTRISRISKELRRKNM